MKKFIKILLLLILATLITYFFLPNNNNYGKLIINEVCANNVSNYLDDDSEYSDYIELYNGYNFDINLKNYYLTDEEYNANKWQFPDIKIKSKEYLIIFASSKDKCKDNVCHTNFKLNSDGETVTLLDKDSNIISKVKYEKMDANMSYGFQGRKYIYYFTPTPGKKNVDNNKKLPQKNSADTIYINEYMISNKTTITDEFNECSDWIELYNYGNEDLNLAEYYLTDDEKNLDKYLFPEKIIKKQEYLIIFLSGKNTVNNYIHTNFKLSENDNYIIISTKNKKIIDKVKVNLMPNDISYGRKDKDWCYFPTATPQQKNNTYCFKEIGG